MRIFLITAAILAAACALTYAFIAWATPISYTTIVNSDLAEKATTLTRELEKKKRRWRNVALWWTVLSSIPA